MKCASKQRPEFDLVGDYFTNLNRHFANWVLDCDEEDDFLGTPRFAVCAMVSKDCLRTVLEGPPAEEFDDLGSGFVRLVLLDEEEHEEESQLVGMSYMVPRIYSLLGGPGWENIVVDGVAIP